MVKSLPKFLLVLSALMATQWGQADNHAAMPAYGGVEVYACDFAEGKDMNDLMEGIAIRLSGMVERLRAPSSCRGFSPLLLILAKLS